MRFRKRWNHNSPPSDADLQTKIAYAFRGYAPIFTTKPPIRVEINDGVVTLQGVVRGPSLREMAGKLAASVANVKLVHNELRDDSAIEIAIAQALATHPDLHLLTDVIYLKSYHGVVTLAGPVSSQTKKLAAETVTGNIPGVTDVINLLTVAPAKNGHRH